MTQGPFMGRGERGAGLLDVLVALGVFAAGIMGLSAGLRHNAQSVMKVNNAKSGQSLKALLPSTLAHGVNRYLITFDSPCQASVNPPMDLQDRLAWFWSSLDATNVRLQYMTAAAASHLPEPLATHCAQASAALSNDLRNQKDMFLCLKVLPPPAGYDKNGQSFLAGSEAYVELHIAFRDFLSDQAITCDAFTKTALKATKVYYALYSRKLKSKVPFSIDAGSMFGRIDIPHNMVVSAFYANILGRTAYESEIDSWSDKLQAGMTRQQMAVGMLLSDENISGTSRQNYRALLKRDPTPAELKYLIPATRTIGQADMVSQTAALDDAYLANGGSPAAYVRSVYENVLGRPPSLAEEDGCIQYVNSLPPDTEGLSGFKSAKNRRRLADFIVNSHEMNARLVDTWYRRFLHRPPDPWAATYWVGQLDAEGMSRETVLSLILGSDEFNIIFYK